MSEATVSLVKGENVEEMVKSAVKLVGGIESYLKRGEKVTLKPNLYRGLPAEMSPGVTTNLKVFEAVIKLVKSLTDDVVIVESDATVSEGTQKFRTSGVQSLANRYGIKCVNLSESDYVEMEIPGGVHLKRMRVANELIDRKIINIPVLKVHSTAVYSGTLKNFFGLLVEGDKSKFHFPGQDDLPHVTHVIPDINSVIKPTLNLVDGIYCMERRGPGGGTPKKLGIVLAGTDPVALDAVSTTIMGISPHEVPHIVEAAKRNLGTVDLDKIDIEGARIEDVKAPVVRAPLYQASSMREGTGMKGTVLGAMNNLMWLGWSSVSSEDLVYYVTFMRETPLKEKYDVALAQLVEEKKVSEVSLGRFAPIK